MSNEPDQDLTKKDSERFADPNRFLVEIPDRAVIARWRRDADVATIARCILGALKYEPHADDTTVLRRALEGVIEQTVRPDCVADWLNKHPTPSKPGRCGWCGKYELPGDVLVPFGAEPGTHAWLHSECWPAWHQARRANAIAALERSAFGNEQRAVVNPAISNPTAQDLTSAVATSAVSNATDQDAMEDASRDTGQVRRRSLEPRRRRRKRK